MKRVLFTAVAAVVAACAFAAQPVKADPPPPTDTKPVTKSIEDVGNQVVKAMLPSWKPRHACLIIDEIDKSWCFTVPFPT